MVRRAIRQVRERLRGALRDDSPHDPGLLNVSGELFSPMIRILGLCAALVVGAQVILNMPHDASAWEIAGAEMLYLGGLGGLILFRFAPNLRLVWMSYALCVSAAISLSFTYQRGASAILLIALAYFIVYRLPLRWSLPALAPDIILVAIFERLPSTLSSGGFTALLALAATLTLVIFGGFAFRSRAITLKDLRDTQAQLRAEMSRNEQLAVTRERARIARDMHDVLAHSLTLLSVQTQAARQLVHRDPEGAARMLDEMATVVRESAAESRRLVSVLREASANQNESPLGERLRVLAGRFGERSGALVSVDEEGTPQSLDAAHEEALRFTLQEALTNAYRHGAAQHIWTTLSWQADTIALDVRDDGDAEHTPKSLLGGGNGLRGMRERAEALGGILAAAPLSEGGYRITLTLPLTLATGAPPQAPQAIQEAV